MTLYELNEKKDKKVEEMYKKAMSELEGFFKLNWKRNKPKIILMKDRKTIDEYKGEKTPDWVVGWAGEQTIYLLNRTNFGKESSHKYSDKDYFQLIKHELCHMFFRTKSRNNSQDQFLWLNEGLANFLSGQIEKHKKPAKFKDFLGQYSDWNGKLYGNSGYAVKVLFDKFGREKLIKLIISLKNVKSKKDFNKNFKEVYGSEPNYKFFNNLLKTIAGESKKLQSRLPLPPL